jgi:hypothetical protein
MIFVTNVAVESAGIQIDKDEIASSLAKEDVSCVYLDSSGGICDVEAPSGEFKSFLVNSSVRDA